MIGCQFENVNNDLQDDMPLLIQAVIPLSGDVDVPAVLDAIKSCDEEAEVTMNATGVCHIR